MGPIVVTYKQSGILVRKMWLHKKKGRVGVIIRWGLSAALVHSRVPVPVPVCTIIWSSAKVNFRICGALWYIE